jgi:hypothetical protein
MSYIQLPDRTTSDTNSAADVNQLQDNIEALKGGTGSTAPTTTIEDLSTDKANDSEVVKKTLFDANTILAATTDDTPAALTIAESEIVGRAPGGSIDGLTDAQVRTILNFIDGQNPHEKQYLGGNTYNSVALNVTGTNYTLSAGVFIPYAVIDADSTSSYKWRLRFNVVGILSVPATSITISIAGVTFANRANFYQPVATSSWNAATNAYRAIVIPNASQITASASGVTDGWGFSGDVELNSKPTWAD